MKNILTAVCCLCICSIAALGEKKPAKGPAMSDQNFINFAAQTDMVEANLGQLAQNRGWLAAGKGLRSNAGNDHTSDFNQLSGVARQAGLSVPSAIDAEHDRTMIGPSRN